jgi:hypothetical protein
MRFVYFIICILLCNKQLVSQKISCHGRITNSYQRALGYLVIVNNTQNIHVMSNAEGNYMFNCYPADTIRFKLLGYEDYCIVGADLKGEKVIVMKEARLPPEEAQVPKDRIVDIGYHEIKRRTSYKGTEFRQSTIIQFFEVPYDGFYLKKYRFFILDYNDSIELKIRVTIGESKSFENENSEAVIKKIRAKNAWIEYDFSDFHHVFNDRKVYIKIEFLDNGDNLCRDNSYIGLMYSFEKQERVITYKNNFKYKDGYLCVFVDNLPSWVDDPISNITIAY